MIRNMLNKLEQVYYTPVINTYIKGFIGWFIVSVTAFGAIVLLIKIWLTMFIQ